MVESGKGDSSPAVDKNIDLSLINPVLQLIFEAFSKALTFYHSRRPLLRIAVYGHDTHRCVIHGIIVNIDTQSDRGDPFIQKVECSAKVIDTWFVQQDKSTWWLRKLEYDSGSLTKV